jgi:hypothetical protein
MALGLELQIGHPSREQVRVLIQKALPWREQVWLQILLVSKQKKKIDKKKEIVSVT